MDKQKIKSIIKKHSPEILDVRNIQFGMLNVIISSKVMFMRQEGYIDDEILKAIEPFIDMQVDIIESKRIESL